MTDDEQGAFGFSGSWREFAPIAFTNIALTIVTLGIYRFWATARTRRYLWSRTRFIDEPLEWTGTGLELFIGFLLVLVLFGIPFLFLQFGAQALLLRGHTGIAVILSFIASAVIFYLSGVARFRALRYRLSRTFWHGIRGGADDNGFGYGFSFMWKYAVGYLPAGLLIPWAMMSLWNERWREMSFGPLAFRSNGSAADVFLRFLLFYLAPFLMVIALGIVGFSMLPLFAGLDLEGGQPPTGPVIVGLIIGLIAIYGVLGLVALVYYAKFLRVAIGGLSLGEIDFHFTARSKHWVLLILGDIALVVLTLGIGLAFLGYRHWSFFIRHLSASGEISLSALTQSTTRAPGQGEGLLDAFDVGAI
ncbi:YjgN family protein [Sphingobium sp. CR28]|uniref:YjgN family protein n=1 Tax=Sphingobium sp. CR28 TaxID=3400272 RepID=UPI003FEF5666